MHETQNQQPDVSTEPQRQALDEMSRQLVDNLNAMVQEQHERAQRFAATQHSLSHLPGLLPPEPPPAPTYPEPPATAAPWPEAELPAPLPQKQQPRRQKRKTPPPFPTQPKAPQEFPSKPLWETAKQHLPTRAANSENKPKKEDGVGALSTIVFIVIILILMRACS